MASRDKAAFVEFAAARSTSLHRAAYLMVGDVGLAQDLVQEALTKTYVAWPRLRDPANAEAYTRKVITTTAISWFRRKSWYAERVRETLPDQPTPGHAQDIALRTSLMVVLAQLPPRQRAVIVLRYFDDLTEAQAAAILGVTVGTVKSQSYVALAKLRGLLGDSLDLSDLTNDEVLQ